MPSGNEVTVNVSSQSPVAVSIPVLSGSTASVAGSNGINVAVAGASGNPNIGGSQEISVSVAGSTSGTPTITNGGTAAVTVTSVGDRGPKGDPGSSLLSNLLDVELSTVAAGDVLRYAGDKWRAYADSNLTDGGNF